MTLDVQANLSHDGLSPEQTVVRQDKTLTLYLELSLTRNIGNITILASNLILSPNCNQISRHCYTSLVMNTSYCSILFVLLIDLRLYTLGYELYAIA